LKPIPVSSSDEHPLKRPKAGRPTSAFSCFRRALDAEIRTG
jgi:hypothetical protein